MAEVWQENREYEVTNSHMLNDNVLCDVTFLVGTNKEEVKAHRFMLASRSPVFYAMFCGPMSETSNTIKIPDIELETMNTFLRFIYTEDCDVSGESVMALLYAAKKYSIKRLEQKCQTFVSEQINCENVCTIFAQAHMLSEMELKQNCFSLILSKGKDVIQSEGFRTLPKELLKEILESDDIFATEEIIYDGCKQWATHQLLNADDSRDISHKEIRNILGDLLYFVRFPIMSIETFTTKCSHDDILSQSEIISIFQFISVRSKGEQFKFIDKRRVCFRNKIITRLPERTLMWNYRGEADGIEFIVSETAMLFGVGLFRPCKLCGTVKGVVSLLSANKSVIVDKEVKITYAQSKYHEEVLFDEGVCLEPGKKYTIKAVLRGNATFQGTNGLSGVTEGDFSITFSASDVSTNGTNVSQGQFPLLILGISLK